jgi:hypothetical protein
MNNSIVKKIAKFGGYFFGVVLLFIGIGCLGIEIAEASTSSHSFSTYVFCSVFIICGVITCLAARMQFRGWILTILGVDFIGFGLVGAVSVIASHLQNSDKIFSGAFYFRMIAYWIIGCICLIFGLMRRCKTENIDDAA